MDYPKAYALLLSCISNTIDEINDLSFSSTEIENIKHTLMNALEKVDEMYISSND